MITSPIIPIWIMAILCVVCIVLFKSKNIKEMARRILIIILIFIINLRIMKISPDVKVMTNNLDILFVVDSTLSMVAEDYNVKDTRIKAVKEDCNYIIEKFTGAKFSVITFNNESQIKIPFTVDYSMALQAVDNIQIANYSYAKGSTMNIALEDMEYLLKSSSEKEGRNRIVFFISDGEITSEEELKSFSKVAQYVDDGAVLGYGTTKGGKMKAKDYYTGEEGYIEDRTSYPYEVAVSKIDEGNLKQIAEDLGIDYIHMEKQSNIDDKITQIERKYITDLNEETKEDYTDIYYIFALPLSILLIYEFLNLKRRI